MKEITSIKEKQKIELDILISFDEFCKENSLRYVLAYGTLIGAIRHQGFIPWDDDIDVFMPRPDYERLISNIFLYPNKHYSIINYKNTKGYDLAYSKIIDNRTILIDDIYQPYASGIFIDVFPIDGLPINKVKQKCIFAVTAIIKRLIAIRRTNYSKDNNFYMRLIKNLVIKIVRRLFAKPEELSMLLDEFAKSFDFSKCDKVVNYTIGQSKKTQINRDDWNRLVKVKFEKHEFYALEKYDEHLRQIYGDYMKLPPESQRLYHENKAFWKLNNAFNSTN